MNIIVKNKKTQTQVERSLSNGNFKTWRPTTVKMNDLSFDKNLFIPMPTGKKIDNLFSAEGGLMKGTNYAIVGDPGVGKSTVMLDILSEGWDVVLIDSMAEVTGSIADFHTGMSGKRAETEVLNLLEKHNKAENKDKINTAFLIIQQVTKMGEFAGSNRFKHMMTGMAHMKFMDEGRAFFFSKNRRGGQMDALFFTLNTNRNVGWLHTQPMNNLS